MEIDPQSWNHLISSFPHSHILQTYQWGKLKSYYGWKPIPQVWRENGEVLAVALVLERTIPIKGFSSLLRVMYVPKGPLLLNWQDQKLRLRIFEELKTLTRKRHAIFIKIDPDVPLATSSSQDGTHLEDGLLGLVTISDLKSLGWVYSPEQIQFRNTIQLDLTLSEEHLLAQMKQKTRYNIRLAQRKGVTIRIGNRDDIELLYRMYAETALRDHFTIRDFNYYHHIWGLFMRPSENCPQGAENALPENIPVAEPFIAEVDHEPVAAVIYYRYAKQTWYFFGMSSMLYRDKMPNYLLQWEAIRRAKSVGCTQMDFWGAPEIFNESDPLFGVYRFKAGFGGRYLRFVGAWDYPVYPILYRIYMEFLPKLLDVMRKRSKKRIMRDAGLSV